MTATDTGIRSQPRPMCMLCGNPGDFIHVGLRDQLFGANGSWNLKQCSREACKLVWLDPMPLEEDLGKAYVKYYTHITQTPASHRGLWKRLRSMLDRGYWSVRFGYPSASSSVLQRSLGWLLYLSPIHRREAEGQIRSLGAVANGSLLDVGCGSGDWMLVMRDLGWQVTGIDFDPNAVAAAQRHGLQVTCGSLGQQRFSDNRFDAVTLSHVIEHLPDPVSTLKECRRILKPGGKLVIMTPNVDSLGHRIFKHSWRGLEPPRHLHIFSLRTTKMALERSGFALTSVRPFIVRSLIYDSIMIRRKGGAVNKSRAKNLPTWFFARLFNHLELLLLPMNRNVGDCVFAVATKT